MGLVTQTFDRLTLKLRGSRILGGEPSFQIWARHAFGFSNYAYSLCTRRTDKSNAYCPFPTETGT